jgi:hypothetical protein
MIEQSMSEFSDIHTKIDALIGHVAALATRDDLTASRTVMVNDLTELRTVMATRDDLAALRTVMVDDLAALRAVMVTRDELTEMRTAIMARIDRLQDAATIQHRERIVDVASSERAERLAKAARDDVASLGEIVTPLIRVVHGMRTQLDDLAEQVRVLKEGTRHEARALMAP